jgi:hypothetical protein
MNLELVVGSLRYLKWRKGPKQTFQIHFKQWPGYSSPSLPYSLSLLKLLHSRLRLKLATTLSITVSNLWTAY